MISTANVKLHDLFRKQVEVVSIHNVAEGIVPQNVFKMPWSKIEAENTSFANNVKEGILDTVNKLIDSKRPFHPVIAFANRIFGNNTICNVIEDERTDNDVLDFIKDNFSIVEKFNLIMLHALSDDKFSGVNIGVDMYCKLEADDYGYSFTNLISLDIKTNYANKIIGVDVMCRSRKLDIGELTPILNLELTAFAAGYRHTFEEKVLDDTITFYEEQVYLFSRVVDMYYSKEALSLDNYKTPSYMIQLSDDVEDVNLMGYKLKDINLYNSYRYDITTELSIDSGLNEEIMYLDGDTIRKFIDQNAKLFYSAHKYCCDGINAEDNGSLFDLNDCFPDVNKNSEMANICEVFYDYIDGDENTPYFIFTIDLIYKMYKDSTLSSFTKFIEDNDGIDVNVLRDIITKGISSYDELLKSYGLDSTEQPSDLDDAIKSNKTTIIDIVSGVFDK
jgi:hypothetical protein